MPKPRVPSYRLHKATGQAVVVLRGRSINLGKYGSAESKAKYDLVIARYLAARAEPDPSAPSSHTRTSNGPVTGTGGDLLVAELVLGYWAFAKGYYLKHGKPTGELYPLK